MCHNSWDCPCDGPEYKCNQCEEKEKQIHNAKEFLESIIEMLYSKQPLNLSVFEDHLDELCHYLDVKIGHGDLLIQRLESRIVRLDKQSTQSDLPMLEQWKEFNTRYLQQLVQ